MPFYTYTATLTPGTTARSNEVETEFRAIETAFAQVETELKRGIKLPSGELTDHVIQSTPGERAGKVVGFDSSGNVQALQTIGQWQGAWAATTAYAERDLVTDSPNGSIYMCNEAHTSQANRTDDASKWDLIVDLQGLLTINNTIVTNADSPIAATAGSDYLVDASGGAVVINLPASPSIADSPITVTHIDGTVTNITIGRNGNNIMGLAEDMNVDITHASFRLMYADASRGWRVSNI